MRTVRSLSILALLATTVLAGDVDALKKRLSDPDPAQRVAAARALGDEKGTDASKLLAGALADREEEVRETALKALGGRRDEFALKALRGALRRFEKDENLLPIVVLALGDSRDRASAGAVADLIPKALGVNARLTRAAIEALGKLRAKESMEALMTVLAKAWDPRPQGPEHPEYMGEVLRALSEQTELPFVKAETWQAWWRGARRSYEGASPDPVDLGTEYRHDGWRFSISRPEGDRFVFTRPSGAVVRVAWRGPKEEAVFAWVDVIVESAREPEAKTLDDREREVRSWITDSLSDRRDEEWRVPSRVGRANALRDSAMGILSGGAVVRWTAWVCERNDLLYTVSAHVESGATEKVREEIQSILDSFRLLDG